MLTFFKGFAHRSKKDLDPNKRPETGVEKRPVSFSRSPRVSHGLHMKVVDGKLVIRHKSRIVNS